MRKNLSAVLLAAGLALMLYPPVSQQLSAAAQSRAVLEDPSVIGVLSVPSLALELPIREGTSEAVLRLGAGLLEGTAFSGHAVLCGHRGLPEAVLFRDLDELQTGDLFSVTLGDSILHYRVTEVLVVSPEDTIWLQPVKAQQLCTLLTCTPYGINSHRLLIRGELVSGPSLCTS